MTARRSRQWAKARAAIRVLFAGLKREAQLAVEEVDVVARAGLVDQVSGKKVAISDEHAGVTVHFVEDRQIELGSDIILASVARTQEISTSLYTLKNRC